MELQEIKESVKKVIVDIVAASNDHQGVAFSDEDSLIDGGIIDSISAIQLIEACSEKFDIIFSPAEVSVDNFDTVTRLSQFIQTKLNGENA